MTGMMVQSRGEETWRAQIDSQDVVVGAVALKPPDEVDVATAQEADEEISKIIAWKKSGIKPVKKRTDSKELGKLKKEFPNLLLKDGILIRKLPSVEQVVIPKSLRSIVYQQLHSDMGHLGAERVGELARQRVYWPWMQRDILDFIQNKCLCLKQRKPHHHKCAPLHNIVTNAPLELITIDFLHLEKGSGGNEYILLIVDHFTKFVQAYPTRNKATKTVAKHLYDDFILRFGIPTKILSDQGGEFESKVIHDLSALAGVSKIRTTPYHPQTNGLCERMNRTLLHMLRTLPETMKSQWPSMVNKLTHAYNCTKHSSTGFTPFRLMFGREPILPIDLTFGLINHKDDLGKYSQPAKRWNEQMKEAYAIVQKNMKDRHRTNENQYNRKPLLMPLAVGDRVLVKNTETGGPGKLRSYWEQDVYVVSAKKGDLEVVFEVHKEKDPKARRRVIHRNMLLPVEDQFDVDTTTNQGEVTKPASKPKARKRPKIRPAIQGDIESPDESTDDSSEEGFTPQSLRLRLRQAAKDGPAPVIPNDLTGGGTGQCNAGAEGQAVDQDEVPRHTDLTPETSGSEANDVRPVEPECEARLNNTSGSETEGSEPEQEAEAIDAGSLEHERETRTNASGSEQAPVIPNDLTGSRQGSEPEHLDSECECEMGCEARANVSVSEQESEAEPESADTETEAIDASIEGFDTLLPIGSSSPKHSPMEIGQRTFEEMFNEGNGSTFEGFAVSVGEPGQDPDPTGGLDDSKLASRSSEEPTSSLQSEATLSNSGPQDRPSPAKTFSERWKIRRNEEKCRELDENAQSELPMRRSNRMKRLINRFDPSVSTLEVQTVSTATQTSEWDDLSQWLQR